MSKRCSTTSTPTNNASSCRPRLPTWRRAASERTRPPCSAVAEVSAGTRSLPRRRSRRARQQSQRRFAAPGMEQRPHRLALSSDLFRKGVDPLGQAEIEIGKAIFAVRGKDEPHFVEPNINIRMVLLFFRHFSDAVDEIDRFGEFVELKSPLDMLLLQLPFRDLFQAIFQLLLLISSAITATRVTSRFAFATGNPSSFCASFGRLALFVKFQGSCANFSWNRKSRERIPGPGPKGFSNRPGCARRLRLPPRHLGRKTYRSFSADIWPHPCPP